jgi:hypothetical protein
VSSFSVQPDELRRLAASLASFRAQLDRVGARLSSLGEAETGHAGVTSALRDFVDHWRYAVGKIDDHARGVEEKLDQAAESYTATDSGIARAAGG